MIEDTYRKIQIANQRVQESTQRAEEFSNQMSKQAADQEEMKKETDKNFGRLHDRMIQHESSIGQQLDQFAKSTHEQIEEMSKQISKIRASEEASTVQFKPPAGPNPFEQMSFSSIIYKKKRVEIQQTETHVRPKSRFSSLTVKPSGRDKRRHSFDLYSNAMQGQGV